MKRTLDTRSPIWTGILLSTAVLGALLIVHAQPVSPEADAPWIPGFRSSARHWLDLSDEDRVITPLPDQSRYPPSEVAGIADNVLRYQKANGGWPKNYDMWAILTQDQLEALERVKATPATTFDNGATHSQVHYLAFAYGRTGDGRYREACLKGLDFILRAQYDNGGWPQSYPNVSGYRRFITFNDGAMVGVMSVLQRIVDCDEQFEFVDKDRRTRIRDAYRRGLDCIVRCQVVEQGRLTAWCQQHDERDLRPREARSFELPSLASEESAEIVRFLMSVDNPDSAILRSVPAAVAWFEEAALSGLRVDTIDAPPTEYRYHSSSSDLVMVQDPGAPPIWARYYELGTGRPLFSNRDGKPVYALADVERERRTGYVWYSYAPAEVLRRYPEWLRRWRSKSDAPEYRQR